jgi:hypothetical protein
VNTHPFNIKVILLSILILWSQHALPAHALIEVPTFRMSLGHSSLNFTAGTLFPNPTPLGSTVTINPLFLWDISSVRSRIGLNFLAELGSNGFGSLPISGIGLSALFYPLGLSSQREVNEDLSVLIKHRVSPYLQLQFTPTKCSISDATSFGTINARAKYFSATVIETSVGLGIDYPMGDDLVTFAGLHYRFAAFTSQETTTGALKYSGLELLIGVMTNFF